MSRRAPDPGRRGGLREVVPPGQHGEFGDAECLTACAGVEASRADQAFRLCRRPGPARQRGAERLAALAERGVDDREHLPAGRRGPRWIDPGERDQARIDPRHGPEHGPRHRPGEAHPGGPGQLGRGHPVLAAARRRAHPRPHLRLHHDQAVLQRREPVQHVEQDRHGRVVGQVGHQHRGRGARQLPHPGGVGRDYLQAAGQAGSTGRGGRRERRGQDRIHLHRDDPVRRLQQRKRQRAETRADFEDDVPGPQARQGHDPPHRSVIDDEVLPEPLGRPHPQPRRQLPDLGRPQQPCGIRHGHRGHLRPGPVTMAASPLGRRRVGGHHGPKMRSPVAVTSAHSSATSIFFTSARRRAV